MSSSVWASLVSGFNPRVREGRDPDLIKRLRQFASFNPRVREGRDGYDGTSQINVAVSIHASARDATYLDYVGLVLPQVSIHASARDATTLIEAFDALTVFQSTRPRGTRRQASALRQ